VSERASAALRSELQKIAVRNRSPGKVVRPGLADGLGDIELACTLGGLTQRDVARRPGTMTEHGVGKQRGLARAALAGDTRLRAEFDALRDRTNSRF
jgi:hypothetical protein